MNPGEIIKSLKSLSPVKKGDRIGKVVSSDRINSIQSILRALCRGDNVVTGLNIRKKTQEGYFILNGEKGGRGGGGSELSIPFQVVLSPKLPDDASIGDPIGVSSNSHLFNSEDKDTYEEDNSNWGLLDDNEPPGDPHAWKNNYLGDKIVLVIELDTNQVIQSIDVGHGAVGTDALWTGYPDPIEINTDDPENPYQQFYHQIIAEITDPDTDPRPGFVVLNDSGQSVQVTQCLFNNLMMVTATTTSDADEPGLPLLVAVPWGMFPGTSTNGEADEINVESDLMTPWQFGSTETLNDYNFELFNASEPGAAKVLVLDGVVYGPNQDGFDPDGMPSNDTYTLDVADGDEVWAAITWDRTNALITGVTLANGATTPDDDGDTTYVTIGNVSVDNSGDVPIVSARNEVCGDIVFEVPPGQDSDANELVLVQDTDDGTVRWEETIDCACNPPDTGGGGGVSSPSGDVAPGSVDGGSPFMPGGGTFGGGGAGSSW